MATKLYGRTEPRIWTRPLRPLTEETSLGFEVIAFALEVLGVKLRPWQEWLLIHALELRPDGSYRFQRIIVLVARQNGKSLIAAVLSAWWLFVDSKRHPDRIPPVKFKVVGIAQSLDIAREPWQNVKYWCDPDPETDEEAELVVPALQRATAQVMDTNGKEGIFCRNRAHYELRAARNVRGKPAPRLIFDELREQTSWAAWNAAAHIMKSFGSLGQMWAFSNAGDAAAIVLKAQRAKALKACETWDEYVAEGVQSAEEWANGNDTSLAIFEWSAPDGCDMTDIDGILQANPSIGYGDMTVQEVIADLPPSSPEAHYRTEALCQWVESRVEPFLDSQKFAELLDPKSRALRGARRMLGVCVAGDRSYSTIGVAGARADGLTHLEVIAQREGNLWVLDYLKAVRKKHGISEVAIQSKGVPSSELVQPLIDAGFTVHRIEGTPMLNMAGHLHSYVERGLVRYREQPALEVTASAGTVRYMSGLPVWDLFNSPVDVAPVVCVNLALYALNITHAPEKKEVPPPPPKAELVERNESVGSPEENLAVIGF